MIKVGEKRGTVKYSPSIKERAKDIFRLLRKAFAGYKIKIIILLVLGFLSGFLEGIGITAIIPLFSFFAENGGASANIVTKTLKYIFGIAHIPFTIHYVIIFIAILFIFKSVASFLSRYITEVISSSYIKEMRIKLFHNTLKASWTYLSKQKIGHLEKTLSYDITEAAALLTLATGSIILIVNIIIYSTIAFNISSRITLITLFVGGIMFLIFKPIVHSSRLAAQKSGIVMKKGSNLVNESIVGIKTVKAMASENIVVNRAEEIFEKWKKLTIRISTLSNITSSALQPIAVLLVLVLFAFSYSTSGFTFASFAVIIYAINKIFTYIQQGQGYLHNINEKYPFLKNIIDHEEATISYFEREEGDNTFTFDNSITFEDASFSYHSKKPALQDIRFSIPRGSITGIVGPSGSGKTTIVDLLLRLIEPESGRILIDKNNIAEIGLKKWREKVGYVSQDIFLTNDTIRNNITFYSQNISDKDIANAIKIANIHNFIETLPHGLDTMVGERGTSLSGGQRQRIVLARVLAREPEILVLDEATSALDNESQAAILESIEKLRGKMTIIIIAHRPATVKNADQLIVIDEGRIVDIGAPADMLANSKSYFHKINEG